MSHLEGNRNARSARTIARQHSERNRISLPRTLMVARCLPVHETQVQNAHNAFYTLIRQGIAGPAGAPLKSREQQL